MTEKTMVMLLGKYDSLLGLATPTPSPAAGNVTPPVDLSTTDNIGQLIGLVFLLVVILIAAYFTSKFVGGIKMGQLKKSNFQVIDSYRISPNKALQIVKIGNKFVVISIGKDTINLITELDETEVMIREFNHDEKQSFKQILDKLKNKNE